ncbi:tetratricopeptide repeat protein [candidate division TA06 bacterium]|uniref:Tetratricopeptide repeat protein n=1 Tax=candidate division TA06 bacterium TaxID=2250710 RepID=A0A523URD3_UNCT6|nr:MAG: tetratricopeptide repeat protein [candidate division TA06 bacterium]
MYEIVWMRLLTLSFGSMVFAVGAVLSSFMAGLALGNFFFGRAADTWRRPLLGYALLEAGIGLTAFLVPPLLNLARRAAIGYGGATSSFMGQALLTFGLSFIVLMIPTALMGGTLPVISRALIRRNKDVAGKVGALYSLNTFGAVLGVALAGLLILPKIGLRNTMLLAVAINFFVAVVVGLISFAVRTPVPGRPEVARSRPAGPGYASALVLASAIGLSGLASMIYEVSWSRSLTLVIGSSIYAFNTMLLSFIFGIGLGSLIFALIFRRRTPSITLFSSVELAIGVSCFLVVLLFDRLPVLFLNMYKALGPTAGHLFFGEILICFLVMLIPTTLFGTTLPMISHILTKDRRLIGTSIGKVYAANTAGCIVGSAGASFALIPILGLQDTLKLAIAVNVLVAGSVFLLSKKGKVAKCIFSASAAALIALVFVAPKQWNQNVMTIGVAPNAVWLEKLTKMGSLEDIASVPELIYHRYGLNSTVAVLKDQSDISLSIDGKTDASAKRDLATQLLIGYVPLFLHSEPETVMVLGLGSGISLAATASFGVRYSECLEIEPAVVSASEYFSEVNRNVLKNPNIQIILADGRNYLLSTDENYDVITSEPSNPWMAGISNLFTKEFYEICTRRLKPGGIMCQFIHGYNLTPEDFKMVMATFSSVFPHKQLWSSSFGVDYLMIGSADEIQIDLDRMKKKMKVQEVAYDLKKIGITTVTDFLAHFLVDEKGWGDIVRDATINTDDMPILEFSAPKSLHLPIDVLTGDLAEQVHGPEIFPPRGVVWTEKEKAKIHLRRGNLFFLDDSYMKAIEEYELAMNLDPDWYLPYLKRASVYQNLAAKGATIYRSGIRKDLETALALSPNTAEIYRRMAIFATMEKEPKAAAAYLKKAIQIRPKRSYYEELIEILVDDLKDYNQARDYVRNALSEFGGSPKLLEQAGFIAEAIGDYQTAADYYRKARDRDPYSSANYRLGKILTALGMPERALEPLLQAVRLGPTFAATHLALAQAYAGSGMKREAAREFKKVLKIDPTNKKALNGLKEL